ncbi:MAG: cysteine synthase A [Chloroflexi bacterium]|nr:cysteine synthase A [Chloroflexota bacterium]
MAELVNSILELVGNTPLVRLLRLAQPGWASLFVKLESFNPSGSIKDRLVLHALRQAEAQGILRPGDTVVEASAGNAAISLALVGAALGYRVVVTMPESTPMERRRLISRFGAEIRVTESAEGMEGAQRAARALVEKQHCFLLNQFENPANPQAHRETTGPEILRATGGRLDAFVAGVGTGGTITGVGEVLKEQAPAALVVAVEPLRSPLLSQGWTGEHGIPGLGADFLPPLLNRKVIDEVIAVSDEDAMRTMNRLAQIEGLLVGVSSGACAFAAMQVAQRLGSEKTVVALLPDSGERYTSFLL